MRSTQRGYTGESRPRGKFRHDDEAEIEMQAPERLPYEDVDFNTCEVRWQRFTSVEPHYRETLADTGKVTDDRVLGLGIAGPDLECVHTIGRPDRFGHARCTTCHGHLWCMSWVAEGLYGLEAAMDPRYADETVEWAERTLVRYCERLPKLHIVR